MRAAGRLRVRHRVLLTTAPSTRAAPAAHARQRGHPCEGNHHPRPVRHPPVRRRDADDPRADRRVVRITASCICGSDLWPYRGENPITEGARIGHEFVGVVEEIGSRGQHRAPRRLRHRAVHVLRQHLPALPRPASSPPAPTAASGAARTATAARSTAARASTSACPLADGTLVATPEVPDDALVPSLLALSDVMGTGWHAAVAARVQQGDTVVVVGDGAVGLSGVLAASRMGAERVVAMSRHASRQADRPASSAPPTSSTSAARRVRRRSASSPAASAPTPCWSASAPTSR